jgi:APA family basic amino acid/polyamine antiporter
MPASVTVEFNPLLRILGIGFGLAVVLGGVIGQGILRTPGIVAGALGDYQLILLVWMLAGLLTMIDALSICELSASIPVSGGPYAFVKRAFGRLAGFVTGWTDWLAQTATASFIAVVFGECLARLGVHLTGSPGTDGIVLILLLILFHFLGTRSSGVSQQIGSAIKALILVGLTILLFRSNPAPAPEAASVPLTLIGVIAAFRAVYATYGGWNAAAYFSEEVRDPGRSLPRAILGGIAIVTVIYVIVNAALLHVLPPVLAAQSSLPVADAASVVLGQNGGWAVALVATIIVLTVENTQLMFTPRILHGMARDHVVPPVLSAVSRTGVPMAALGATGLLAIALTSSGAYNVLLAIYAPLSVTTNAFVNLAAIRMRTKEPDLPRPFRMPLFPLPSLIALAINLSLAIAFLASDFGNTKYALLLLISGLPIYWWCTRRGRAPRSDTV